MISRKLHAEVDDLLTSMRHNRHHPRVLAKEERKLAAFLKMNNVHIAYEDGPHEFRLAKGEPNEFK